jgi:hypothetical protein
LGPTLARYGDLVVLALALPLFLLAGLPLLGWGFVAAYWVAQRAVHDLIFRRASAAADPRRTTMVLAISMMARVWLFALVVFAAGAIDREAGLSAAVLAIVLVTAYLFGLMTTGPLSGPGGRR